MPFQIRRGEEGEIERERGKERKEKKKEKLQPWLEKFHLISISMRVHDDDATPSREDKGDREGIPRTHPIR